jgi:hypothetical protein
MLPLTPYPTLRDAARFIAFHETAFGFSLIFKSPGGMSRNERHGQRCGFGRAAANIGK